MRNKNEPMITLTDTNTTTNEMLTPEIEAQLEQLECWRRDQQWTEEVMHGLAANAGADQSRLFFSQIMYTVRQSAPERLVPFMNTYIRGLKDGVHVKDSLEYAVTFQQTQLLSEILTRYEGNPFWSEWGTVYRFLLRVVRGEFSHEDVLKQSQVLSEKVSEQSLKIRLDVVRVLACINLNYDERSLDLIENISQTLEHMETSFFKAALISRIALEEASFFIFVDGDMAKAEQKFSVVIMNNATPSVIFVMAYHRLGLATLCKSKKFCLSHFESAIRHAKQAQLTDYQERLENEYYPLARNVYGEHFDLDNVSSEEQIHQYIVRGETKKALFMIKELQSSGEESVFLNFYKAKATKDLGLLSQAREQFKAEKLSYMLPLVDREINSL